jgi:hypothetical protein
MGDGGAGRRAVVIGSQCDALGESGRLSFLPELATELYGVLIDPRLGACAPGLPDRPGGGLLLDPTHDEVLNALEEAFARADSDSATLLVAMLGHGMVQFGDSFFSASTAPVGATNDVMCSCRTGSSICWVTAAT